MAGDKNYPQIRREREAREQSERERRGGLHVQARMLQVARDQVRASNRTNILLGVTFTVTFAAVVIAFFAYFSTKDANRIAEQANKDSKVASDKALKLAETSNTNAVTAADESNKTALRIAEKANQLNREQLAIDRRPWLSLNYEVEGWPWGIESSVAQWGMQIEQILGNHGRTPANNVTVATRLIPLADIGVNVDIELEKLCKATQRTDFSSVHRLPIVYQEQETRILREVTIAEDEWTKREQDAPADSSFWLMMIGCATYESSSGVIKGVTPFAADVQILDDCSWRPIQDDSNDVDGWRQFSREKGLARERSPNAKMCLVPVAINARAK